jgi:hypothetical protein
MRSVDGVIQLGLQPVDFLQEVSEPVHDLPGELLDLAYPAVHRALDVGDHVGQQRQRRPGDTGEEGRYERTRLPAISSPSSCEPRLSTTAACGRVVGPRSGSQRGPVEIGQGRPVPGGCFGVVGRVVGHGEAVAGGVELDGVVDRGVA